MKVQVLSRKLIAPASPTPEHLRSFKISYLDQLAPPFYVPRVFYYLPNGVEESRGTAEKGEQLQKSIAETLTLFYPLAGRYIKEKLLVDCNDEGAEYVEAQVSGCLSLLLGEGGGELRSEWLDQLVPELVDSDSTPLALFQFNKFECGGVAIGVCLAHRVADGSTVFTFIDTWAKASRMGVGKKPFRPSFQLGSLFLQREVSTPKVKLGAGDDTLTMKRLVFNAAAISNLKAIATGSSSNVNDSEPLKYRPTRVEVVLAFIWMSLIRVDRAKNGRLRPSILSIPINMRKKTNSPVPDNSCGNFVGRAVPKFFSDEDHNTKMQLHDLVVTVHDAIRCSIANFAKASTPDDIISLVNHANEEVLTGMHNPDVNCCFSSSWCRFPKYEADFGWGKPSWVSPVMIPKMRNIIGLLGTKDGDGIEAWVTLDQSSMNLYQQDSEIMPLLG